MDARLLPMGRSALLLEVADTDAALALRARLAALVREGGRPWTAVDDLVLGARTLLVTHSLTDAGRRAELAQACLDVARELDPTSVGAGTATARAVGPTVVEIAVRYDGPDLDEVARLTGLSPADVVRLHTTSRWRVGFGGFAPGFAYLVGGDPRLRVPRRAEPRPRVPVGSVALAGEFSGIYPQDSPGGWQLIGSTDAVLWDVDRDPPALLTPGTEVRFTDLGATPTPTPNSSGPAVTPVRGTGRPLDEVVGRQDAAGGGGRPLDEVVDAATRWRGLEVLATGPLALVQDLGRRGYADVGVGRSGAADPESHRLALRLVGHVLGPPTETDPGPATLEAVLGGLAVRAHGDLLVALTGAPAPADVDGRPVPHAAPVRVADGQVLTLGTPPSGLRTWLAVRGGIDVRAVLGSRSTDTLSRVGPAALAVGDRLAVGPAPTDFPVVDVAPVGEPSNRTVVLEIEPGPRAGWCDLDGLTAPTWVVSPRSNRVGIRLQGNAIRRHTAYEGMELPSEGMVVGAVQVPAGGEPVVFLADHPVTGGYPVVAVLTPASVSRAAQLRPGQEVRLSWAGSPPTRA